MTFEEFAKIPEPQGLRYELHHGELVEMPFPKMTHARVQHQIQRLLAIADAGRGIVTQELGFVSIHENDARRGDIVYVTRERWEAQSKDDYFHGAPDLVVEVLSPSNTMAEMRDKRKLCLANGSVEFWLVDPSQRDVEVWTRDGRSVTYGAGQRIPLFFAPDSTVDVDAIFA
jgi:Uma2 family endonuclease